MSKFLLVTLLLHIPLYVYPILRLCYWAELPFWLTLLIFTPLVSSQYVSRFYLRKKNSVWTKLLRRFADFYLGVSSVLLIATLLAEIFVGFDMVTSGIAVTSVIAITVTLGIVATMAALLPMVKTITLSSGKLTAPVRFVQITDVHIGSRKPAFLDRVVHIVNELKPDFLCITGDLIDGQGVSDDDLKSFKSVVGPIYFTIGNHEKYEGVQAIARRLENLGVTVLRNAETHFTKELQVIGIDDMDDANQVAVQLEKQTLDLDAFVLLLYHRPRGLKAAAEAGVDLMLSGHTHNGQIMPFNLVVNRVFDMVKGLYEHAETKLYVSQGTGTWGPIMRLGTRSEITLFEISPAQESLFPSG
jgi:predicted MPP superfamily phosphohydrolase